ncbi:hypothetical protein HK405_000244, partial [Cladochytrium tenue]
EINWDGASQLFPDAWELYKAPIPEEERDDFVKAYHRRLTGPNPDERRRCGLAWSTWEMATSKLYTGFIVNGRYDVVCPVTTAWELHRKWPEAEIHLVSDAGHSAKEPGIAAKLVEAADMFASRLSP